MAHFHFDALTPDLILDAIESTGLYVESGLLALNSYENRVYQFKAEDQQRYVAKFYRPERWSDAAILEEHGFIAELKQAELDVIPNIEFAGSSLVHYQGWRLAIQPSIGGRSFEQDNLDHLEWLGRLLGRLHAASGKKTFTHREHFSSQSHLIQPLSLLSASALLPSGIAKAFLTILEQVVEVAGQQFNRLNRAQPQIRLHGDCHLGNVLWRDDKPWLVDFDDCRMGPAVQDLWMMLSGTVDEQKMQLDALLCGYEEFCAFSPSQLALIEPLRAMRMVHYISWLASRWQDGAFQQAFPWFATEKYWEQQVLALKEQFAALHAEPLSTY